VNVFLNALIIKTPAYTAKLAQTGLPPTAMTSTEKTNGHRTHLSSTIMITMSEELCLNATRHFNTSRIPSMSCRKSCSEYETICHRTPPTRPSTDYELVWKLWAHTLNMSGDRLLSKSFELVASGDNLK